MEIKKFENYEIIEILNFEEDNAVSVLWKINNINILLDCGLPDNYSIEKYKKYANILKNLNIILISRPDIRYCGALNYLINYFNPFKVICTVPTKYLIEEIMNNIYCLFELEKKNLENHYKNINLIEEVKFRENLKIKINDKNKVKIKFYEIGDQIGSSLIKLNINKYKIVYLANPRIENQNFIKKFNMGYIENINIDLLILGNKKTIGVQNSIKDMVEGEFKKKINNESCNFCYVVDNITNLFKIFLEIIRFLKEYKDNVKYKVLIPFNCKNYIEILKSLTEYMSNEINYDFYEENQYLISEFKYYKDVSRLKEQCIYISLYQDIIYGVNKKLFESVNKLEFIFYGDTSILNTNIDELKAEYETKKTNLNFNYNFEFKENILKTENSTIHSDNIYKKDANEDLFNSVKDEKFDNENDYLVDNNWFNVKSDFFSFNISKNSIIFDDYGQVLSSPEIENFKILQNNSYKIIKINYKEDYRLLHNKYIDQLIKFYEKINKKDLVNVRINLFKQYNFSPNSNLLNIIKLLKVLDFQKLYLLKNDENEVNLIKKYYSPYIVESPFKHENSWLDLKILNNNIISKYNNNLKNNSKFKVTSLNFSISKENLKEKNYKRIIIKEGELENNNFINDLNDKRLIIKDFNWLDLKEFLLENNIIMELNFSVLSFKDSLFIKKYKDKIIIESFFNKDYLEIRKQIYKFIKVV